MFAYSLVSLSWNIMTKKVDNRQELATSLLLDHRWMLSGKRTQMTTLALTLNFYHFSTATPTRSYPGCQGHDMSTFSQCHTQSPQAPPTTRWPRCLRTLGKRLRIYIKSSKRVQAKIWQSTTKCFYFPASGPFRGHLTIQIYVCFMK